MNDFERKKYTILRQPAVHGSEGQPVTQPTMHQSPVRLVIIIALSVLVSEAFVMIIIISFLQPSSALFEVLFDSAFLVVLLSPMFYFFIFRPLVLHITEHKRAEETLRQSEREAAIRNQIADIFLTITDEDMYGEVLQVILQTMESKHGVFGYIDQDGNMVAPSLTRDIWDQCQVPDKNIVFPRETWGGIWGRAMIEKRTLCANELFHVPEGHMPVFRAMTVPIVHQGGLIGVITVGNKATDYDEKDQELLESIAAHIAPVLHARLQRDRQERARSWAEEEVGRLAKFPSENPNPVLRIAKDGTILYANKASLPLLNVWGCQEDQPLPDDWRELTLDALSSGAREDAEVEVGDRILSLTFAPVVDADYVNVYGLDITGRVRAEEALEEHLERLEDTVEQRTAELCESKEKLRAQYKGIPVPTYTWQGVKDDFVLVDYNDAAVAITQGRIADLVGKMASEMYRDMPEILQEFSQCLTEKTTIEREMAYRFRSTSESRHLAVKYAFVPPDLILVHTEDITERQRAERELQQNYDAQTVINSLLRLSLQDIPLEELLRRTLDLLLSVPWLAIESRGSIFLVEDEPEVLVMKVQKGLEKVPQKTCAQMSFGRCLCGRAALRQEVQFADRLDDRHEIHFEGMTPHGHYCVPMLSAGRTLGVINLYLREGHRRDQREEDFLTAVANTVAGIVMRRQAEEALKVSEEQYRSLFDGLPVGLYRTTSEGQILDVNPALVKMLGYPDPESLLAVNVADLYVAPEDRGRWQALIDREEVVRDAEVQIRRHDGTVIWVRDTARAIRNADPPVVYYEGAVEDITARKQAQAALIEAEKLAIAGKLAASLAHEINNPLQTVIGCLGLAEETLAEGGDVSRYVQMAREELRRTANIVAQLRDLHRPSKPEDRAPTDVNALLEQVLDLSRKQCESRRIEVSKQTADLPALPLVADQIKQVFLNLLLNAIEAMPQGGRLQVSTTYASQPAGIRIAFTDSGAGIAPDVLPHVFEPFYSTRPEGLGLGLFISHNIVKQHGGQIEVDSRVGEGTTFMVWLPA